MRAEHDVIEFEVENDSPYFDIVFTGCRTSAASYIFDIVDFVKRRIDRWTIPFVRNDRWSVEIREIMYPENMPYGYTDTSRYCDDHYMTPHTAQLAPNGKLFATFGVSENGFGIGVIDTNTGEYDFIDGGIGGDKLFVSTGDFDENYRNFYFASWPLTNKPRDSIKSIPNKLDVCALDLNTLEQRHVYTLAENIEDGRTQGPGLPRSLHQISLTKDGRYLVGAPYDGIQEAPATPVLNEKGDVAYKLKGKHRIILEDIITVDLKESKHWFTKIPVPVPAHIEYDLDDPYVFYASAHNIAGTTVGTSLEGTATLFRLQIKDGKTDIIGAYTDAALYRITQHSLFRYKDQVLVVLTCVPNRLVIVDTKTMTLWRNVELFPAEPIVLTDSGALSPESAFSVYSVNPCADGKYVVLENGHDFIVYGLDEDRVLTTRVSRNIPPGVRGRGHTRTAGQ